MNYIKSIFIENFQSHKETKLEFSDGLNVIVGPSDQGKSAIIRAMKWVLFNEPRGSEFIRHGESFARVTIEIDNGYKVMRERSSSKNRYTVIDINGECTVYEGFGNEVPIEVVKTHGISKVLIDTDSNVSLNLGEQLESPFLIADTGSVKAKAIGRLTGAHIIDKSIRDCLIDIKHYNQTETRAKKEIEELEEKLKEYEQIDELKSKIDKKEQILHQLKNLIQKLKQIEEKKEIYQLLIDQLSENQKIIRQVETIDKAEIVINKIAERILIFKQLCSLKNSFKNIESEILNELEILNKVKDLDNLGHKINVLEEKLGYLTKISKIGIMYTEISRDVGQEILKMQKLDKIEQYNKNINEIDKLINKFNIINQINVSIKALSISISDGEKYLVGVDSEIEKNIKEYESQLKKIGKCPVCFSQIDDQRVGQIVHECRR